MDSYIELSELITVLETALKPVIGDVGLISYEAPSKFGGKELDLCIVEGDKFVLRWLSVKASNQHTYVSKKSILEKARKQLSAMSQPWGKNYVPYRELILKVAEKIQ